MGRLSHECFSRQGTRAVVKCNMPGIAVQSLEPITTESGRHIWQTVSEVGRNHHHERRRCVCKPCPSRGPIQTFPQDRTILLNARCYSGGPFAKATRNCEIPVAHTHLLVLICASVHSCRRLNRLGSFLLWNLCCHLASRCQIAQS